MKMNIINVLTKKIYYIFLVLLMISNPAVAKQIAEVDLVDSIVIQGQALKLNGAGIRSKFVFDVYIAALYSQNKISDIKQINNQSQPIRIEMHILYDEIGKEKLIDAWNDGFEDNLTDVELAALKSKIRNFNKLFTTVFKGDVLQIDYLPNKGTQLTVNGKIKGVIEGYDFFQALMKIWLGEEPASESLKAALLGQTDSDNE